MKWGERGKEEQEKATHSRRAASQKGPAPSSSPRRAEYTPWLRTTGKPKLQNSCTFSTRSQTMCPNLERWEVAARRIQMHRVVARLLFSLFQLFKPHPPSSVQLLQVTFVWPHPFPHCHRTWVPQSTYCVLHITVGWYISWIRLLTWVRVCLLLQLCLSTGVSEEVIAGGKRPRVSDWQRKLDRAGKLRKDVIKTIASNSVHPLNVQE